MERIITQMIHQIKEKETTLIGISGHGGSGKTTLAKALIDQLDDVNYINTDPYIIDSTLRKKVMLDYTYNGENHRYKMTASHPSAHHLLSLERDIRMLREQKGFYTIDVPYLERTWIDPAKKVTILEGMSAAFLNESTFDVSVYLYTDSETELKRRSVRDVSERGMDLDYLRRSHDERRIQYELFMHPYRDRFQTVVFSSGDSWTIEKSPYKNRS